MMNHASAFDQGSAELQSPGLLGKLRSRMMTAFADRRARHHLAREIEDIAASGELDRFLADTGLSRADLDRVVEQHPRSARLFDAMLHRLGIDDTAVPCGATKREMERTCSTCAQQGRCENWLRSGATSGYDAFCPNAASFEDLGTRH